MRNRAAVVAMAGLVSLASLGFSAPAQADGPPLHGHMLVLGVKYVGGEPVGFRKCVEMAGGREVGLNAHHENSHTGRAGEALGAAGNAVVPTAPLSPIEDCAHLKELFPA